MNQRGVVSTVIAKTPVKKSSVCQARLSGARIGRASGSSAIASTSPGTR